jgi:hypothetical protein
MKNSSILLFEENLNLTDIRDFGYSWDTLNDPGVPIPPEGARFDLSFAGRVEGPLVSGRIEGTDFLTVRADGRFMLDIQATITTDDGVRIAVREDGVLNPTPEGIGHLRLNLAFTSHDERYAWLNHMQVWAAGEVETATGAIFVQAFAGTHHELPAAVAA